MNGFGDFDEDFAKAVARPKFASEGLKALPDGDYEVEITAGIKKEGDEHGPRFTFLMIVVGECPQRGWQVEKTLFLTKGAGGARVKDDKRVTELKTDLATIGFDVANWTPANKRPFAAQLAIACEVMKGCKLKVRKKFNAGDGSGEGFHNLYINKRLGEDGKPEKFGAAEMQPPVDPFAPASPPAAHSNGHPAAKSQTLSEDDAIPF